MKALFFILPLLMVYSCSSNDEFQKDIDWDKKKSMDLNRKLAKKEKLDILMYLENHPQWKMEQTGSGLFYQIIKKKEGEIHAKPGMEVAVKYKISFLNGDLCYETPKNQLSYFKIDHSDIESGVQEGVKKMRKGEKAVFIVSSHLAHGITGDQNKIPPATSLVVEIELVDLF
ncbi:MAG: FKBP-type peptidyl-prolyl cis-trans isomerase [Crocinitomicaceae bacterium]|jgi:FKBP-type peptidyl-prolyl cis-trans isomerase